MMQKVYINLVVEDALSEKILLRIINDKCLGVCVASSRIVGGFGNIKKSVRAWNNASKHAPFLALTDLDKAECAPNLISKWFEDAGIKLSNKCDGFLLRVAVREVESWLLADCSGLKKLLSLSKIFNFSDPESLSDPKQELLQLALKSNKRKIREGIVHPQNPSKQGPGYNLILSDFIQNDWDLELAIQECDSLKRLISAINGLKNS